MSFSRSAAARQGVSFNSRLLAVQGLGYLSTDQHTLMVIFEDRVVCPNLQNRDFAVIFEDRVVCPNLQNRDFVVIFEDRVSTTPIESRYDR